MISEILVDIVGVFIAFFVFWKRLREDYTKEQLFSLSFYLFFGVILANTISAKYYPAGWFWASIFGIAIAYSVRLLWFKARFIETLEAIFISFLPWLDLTILSDSVKNESTTSFIAFCVVAAFLALFSYLDTHYKKFVWYTSGRVGIAGAITMAVFFTARIAIACFSSFVVSFVERKYEIGLSGAGLAGSLLIFYNLARKHD
jgi:hypothetical protein